MCGTPGPTFPGAANVVARRLYASLGFTEYGIEMHSLKVEGRYLDEVLMVKILP